MILSAIDIQAVKPLSPILPRTREHGVTYGLGPAGYDVRVEFDAEGEIPFIHMEPGEFRLASTVELFHMPLHIIGIVHDKSTWARRGLAVQNTVIEPGWGGHLTLELTNHGTEELKIYRGQAIAQILFHMLTSPTDGYEGKYQNQERGPVEAREDS